MSSSSGTIHPRNRYKFNLVKLNDIHFAEINFSLCIVDCEWRPLFFIALIVMQFSKLNEH